MSKEKLSKKTEVKLKKVVLEETPQKKFFDKRPKLKEGMFISLIVAGIVFLAYSIRELFLIAIYGIPFLLPVAKIDGLVNNGLVSFTSYMLCFLIIWWFMKKMFPDLVDEYLGNEKRN